QFLKEKYLAEGYEVLVISRSRGDLQWSDKKAIGAALEGATLVINLAGKSVDCRYNEKNRKEILNSRIDSTNILGDAIKQCLNPPELWINSSTATIYRHAEDRPMSEEHGEIGSGFSVGIAKAWEAAFFSHELPATRRVALRISIVLGKTGGAIRPILNLVRFGLGGKQGDGRQMFSWIHIEDLYRIIKFVEEHKALNGVYNCASPLPVTNTEFMRTVRQIAGTPLNIALPAPAWLLSIGAVIIRTEPELILKSRWVIPEKLTAAGFEFQYKMLEDAVEEIVRK
ncbi:MAG: TIGR01777 family protein, partial [Chitinophagaceae bacterium]